MLKIKLSALQFHSYHGVHEDEKKTGGNFEVNLIVLFKPAAMPVKHLNETIDYTQLYNIIKLRMNNPTPLLETIATEIAQEVFDTFSITEEVAVSVTKLNPPIPNFNGNVSAEYTLKRIKNSTT